ncbi:hypothetical protein [uncultured Ruminococcus sp.]|uniref:hypothetical protein n=1 Tax=uncultured Ruminococcus sp. TaxID=165186 RepID=UPI0025F8A6F8|nr:hypothetical protein [uncultured Ruminococcus sp.]
MKDSEGSFWVKHRTHIILLLMIVLQLLYSTYMFMYRKQSCHSDEIWCYGLSNSYYKPFIYLEDGIFQDEYEGGYAGSDITGRWVDGSVFSDYLTVQEGERFAYGSVYHNQVLDHHPPLYYSILHTICSFFPNSFSLWYTFAINLVCMAVTQIFLFRLTKLVSGRDITALTVCGLYGAGKGALSTILFLRQYCFMTMLITMFYYFSARMLKSFDKEKGFDIKRNVPPAAVTAFLLFFTNYTMCMICGAFTAFLCIYMICRKRIKQMFAYGLSMTAALGAFLAAYPYVITHTLNYKGAFDPKDYKLDYPARLRYLLGGGGLLRLTLGIRVSIFKSYSGDYIIGTVLILAVLCVPLCFLFRKETWFIENRDRLFALIKRSSGKFVGYMKNSSWFIPVMAAANLVFVLILPSISDIIDMGTYVVRYVFIVMPALCLTAVTAADTVLSGLRLKKKELTTLLLAAGVLIRVNVCETSPMETMHSKHYTDLAKVSAGRNVVLFPSRSDGNVWQIQCFPSYLRDANSVFITSTGDDKSFPEKTDGRKVDLVILPVDDLIPDGEWYDRCVEEEPIIREEKESGWQVYMEGDTDVQYPDDYVFGEDQLEIIDKDGKAKLLYVLNMQTEHYAVISLD